MRGGQRVREAWQPSEEDIALVRLGYESGDSRAEIAQAVGISLDMLDRHRAGGSFGPLPTRRGHGGGRRTDVVPDGANTLFGLHRSEWESRQREIVSSWPEDERLARSRGLLPNDRDPDLGKERFGRMASNPTSRRVFTDQTRSRSW